MRSGKPIVYSRLSEEQREMLEDDLDYYQLSITEEKSDFSYSIKTSPLYSAAASENNANALTDGNANTGVAIDSPGWIIFKFQKQIQIMSVKVDGYRADAKMWPSSTGSGAKVYYSDDKSNWTDTGKILPNLSTCSTLDLGKITCKYVKFQHSSHLGLSLVEFQ